MRSNDLSLNKAEIRVELGQSAMILMLECEVSLTALSIHNFVDTGHNSTPLEKNRK